MGYLPIVLFSLGFLFLIFQVSYFTLRNARRSYDDQKDEISELLTSLSQKTMTLEPKTADDLKGMVHELSPQLESAQRNQLMRALQSLLFARRTYNGYVQKMPTMILARLFDYQELS